MTPVGLPAGIRQAGCDPAGSAAGRPRDACGAASAQCRSRDLAEPFTAGAGREACLKPDDGVDQGDDQADELPRTRGVTTWRDTRE